MTTTHLVDRDFQAAIELIAEPETVIEVEEIPFVEEAVYLILANGVIELGIPVDGMTK